MDLLKEECGLENIAHEVLFSCRRFKQCGARYVANQAEERRTASAQQVDYQMDELDRAIINELQGGFPVCDRPFAEVAVRLHSTEQEIISRIDRLLKQGTLSRFGPMYHAERMGGSLSLAAMKIPDSDFERVAEILNGYRKWRTTMRATMHSACGSCLPRKHPRNMRRRSKG